MHKLNSLLNRIEKEDREMMVYVINKQSKAYFEFGTLLDADNYDADILDDIRC